MSLKIFSRSLPTFIVIILICSITPVMAIQAGNNQLEKPLSEDYDVILKVFDNETSTELTTEQDLYLEQNQYKLKTKVEATLYNFQDFINYLLYKNSTRIIDHDNSPNRINPNKINFGQRKLMGLLDTPYTTAETDATAMRGYLNTHFELNNPNMVDMEDVTYEELSDGTLNLNNVIVQIKEKGVNDEVYIRYMKIISTNNEYIVLKSGNKEYHVTSEQFKKQCAWKDDANNYKVFILVIPDVSIDLSCSNTDLMLYQIWSKQNTKLTQEISRTPMWIAFCAAGLACGLGVLAAGCYRICDGCLSPTRQIINENVDEESGLMEHDHLRKSYTVTTEATIPNRCCNRCKVTSSITVAGAFIIMASIIAAILVYNDKITTETELANLKEFIVPNPTLKPKSMK